MFLFFKIRVIPVSGLPGRFSVQGMELIFTNRKRDSGARFGSPEFCVPFTQTVNRLVVPYKWQTTDITQFDSEDDYHTGFQNVSHCQQQS